MKKVLAIYYSQSGQSGKIVDNFCAPFIEAGIEVETVRIHLKNDFPFPWTTKRFFSVMPDCVLGVVHELEPLQLQHSSYDLIILGYQPWFLSPSIPFHSLLQNSTFKNVIKKTPVITITGVRNMWVSAFEKIKTMLKDAGANHVGTVALYDRHLNLVSIFTIFHWMLKGKKDRYLRFFPLPGVAETDIENTKEFGKIALPYFKKNEWNGLQEKLIKTKAADPKYHLMFIESKAAVMFRLWAKLIIKKHNQTFWLALFKYYLLIALFIAAPLVWIIDIFIFKPFLSKYIQNKKAALLKLN